MSVREIDHLRKHVDALQAQVTELKISLAQARRESREQVRARIRQVKADIDAHQEPAREKAAQTAGRAQSQWQMMRADAAAKMRDLHDRIERKRDELDVKMAEDDAMGAEESAIDALGFARWAAEQAEVAVLDAVDARSWADERAAESRTS